MRMKNRTTLASMTALLSLGLSACQNGSDSYSASAPESQPTATHSAERSQSEDTIVVSQAPGKTVYWVLPGERELDPDVFGSPQNPKMTLEPVLKEAKRMADQGEILGTVPRLLQDLPILVAVPMKARTEQDDGNWVLKQPNPFSDKANIVSGQFTATFNDRVQQDSKGKPGDTEDSATMEATFTDPKGNEYRAVLDHVVQPPFPGYETDGGVLLHGTHHGDTGTGSPLMPEVDTIAAFWGVGNLHVNGEKLDQMHVMHMMTTEVVRNSDYELAFEEDLPLDPSERQIADQSHHTHLVILPVSPEPGEGPVFNPVQTAFTLPNGENQPFIHIMYEEDQIDEDTTGRSSDYASR